MHYIFRLKTLYPRFDESEHFLDFYLSVRFTFRNRCRYVMSDSLAMTVKIILDADDWSSYTRISWDRLYDE